MNKVWLKVGLAALVVTMALMLAVPVLAEGPVTDDPSTGLTSMWQRMRGWFRGANAGENLAGYADEDCPMVGAREEGEYGWGRGMGMWNRDGVAGRFGGEGAFGDEDGDGLCDACGRLPGQGREGAFVDEDGDGVCDECGGVPGQGRAGGFVDEDGDGLCDTCGQSLDECAGDGACQLGEGLGGRWQTEGGVWPMMRGGMMGRGRGR